VAVVVFDADVLIAYLGRNDANHPEAVERMRRALASSPTMRNSSIERSSSSWGELINNDRRRTV